MQSQSSKDLVQDSRSGKLHVQAGENEQAAMNLQDTENPHTTDGKVSQALSSTVSNPNAFSYEPLGPNEYWRCLELCPASDSEAHIEYRFLNPEIDKSARSYIGPLFYEALSYTWGAEPATMYILLNNATFYIRPNLYSALKQPRSLDKSRLLRIHAICINQEDLDERNIQVRIMRHIFQLASNTIIWLGKGDSSSDRAMKFLKTTGKCFEKARDLKSHIL